MNQDEVEMFKRMCRSGATSDSKVHIEFIEAFNELRKRHCLTLTDALHIMSANTSAILGGGREQFDDACSKIADRLGLH